MKKIIFSLGIIFLSVVLILNIIYTADLDVAEHITISLNSFVYVLGLIIVGIVLFLVTRIINRYLYNSTDSKIKEKIRKILFITCIAIYLAFNIFWIMKINPPIVGDQEYTSKLAQTFYNNDPERSFKIMTYAEVTVDKYVQAHQHQIPLAFLFNIFFKIIKLDVLEKLRIINIIANVLTVIALYKINKQLSKKYEMNNSLMLVLIFTFISLIMMANFVYGDIASIPLCLFSVYFVMRYTETQKTIYAILASILSMIAYMFKMNSLIFIIAIVIYLLLNLFKEINTIKLNEKLIKIAVIVLYIIICIVPSYFVKNYYLDKYNLDKNKSYPMNGYVLMGMEEGERANGWYKWEIGASALSNLEGKKEEYNEKIKERLIYFSKNIGYTFKFYTDKITSMWAENTYSAIRNNTSVADDPLEDAIEPLTFYQKALLILMCACSIIALVQNRKNISLEIILLVTIFIGGFTFHILWEAKSRYIIPYIVALIPLASINLQKFKIKIS